MKTNEIHILLSATTSYLCGLLGGWDNSLNFLLSVMVIDYLTALINCLVFKKSPKTENGGFSSTVGAKGLFKKFAILLCIFLGCQFDMLLNVNYVRDGACIFFIINEVGSIIENLQSMGVDIPDVLNKALNLLKGEKHE